MKRLVVSSLILLAGFFILTRAFAAEENKKPKVTEGSKAAIARAQKRRELVKKLRGDLKFLENPAAVHARVRKYEDLKKPLAEITRRGGNEAKEWTQGLRSKRATSRLIEDKQDLAEDVQKQAILELAFIRKLAIEEKASKTTAAIEALMLDKQQRYSKVLDDLREGRKEIRHREREAKALKTKTKPAARKSDANR